MKKTLQFLALALLPCLAPAVGLDDLAAEPSPDDIMLRKPAAAKPVAKPVVQPVEAPKPAAPVVQPVVKPVEAPKPAAPVAKPVEAPKPVAKPAAQTAPAAGRARAPREPNEVVQQPAAPAPAPVAKPVVKVTKVGEPATKPEAAPAAKPEAKKAKKALTGRPAVITAERTDYDRKEGVILFDRNVFINDEQYQMHADRLFVFLDGTNDLKRLVALGSVALTNDTKSAGGTKAVYTKSLSRIVLYGTEESPAWLRDVDKRRGDASEVRGLRITYWIDSGLATVDKIMVTMPGLKGSNNPKEILGGVRGKDAKKEDK